MNTPDLACCTPRRYRGASLEQRQSERRAKLIEAGLTVIGSVGYHAATVRAICTEAGLTERYFYESFENSEALLRAVYTHIIDRLRAETLAALQRAPREADAMSEAALRVYFGMNRDPHFARINLFEVLGVSPNVDQLYRNTMSEFAALLASISKSLYPGKVFTRLDEDLVTQGMIGAVVQITHRWVLGGYQQSLDEVVRNTQAIFSAVNRQLLAPTA